MLRLSTKLLIFLLLFSGLLLASDGTKNCPHGDLSPKFCDKDNDMLADAENNPDKWIDPYTLIFGYTENQELYEKAQKALGKYIEKHTGKKIKFFRYLTNAAQLEAMRNGMLHVVSLNTGSVPPAVRCSGFRLFAMAAKSDGSYGYTMQIITYPGSGVNNINEIKDHTVLYVTPTSNSGYKAPYILLKKHGMTEGIDYRVRFSGSHTKSILRVASKKAKVAAIADGVLSSMIASGKVKKDDIKVIYTSKPFPGTGFGYPYNLKPSLAAKIKKAFLTFKWSDDRGKYKEINKYHDARFIPAEYKSKWSLVRAIDKENDKDQSCR